MTRPGGLSPKGILKIAIAVALAIAGIFVALQIIAAIQQGLSALSQTAQGILLVSVGLVAWGGRRYLARDREQREREQARAAAAAGAANLVTDERRRVIAPVRVVGNRERWDARFFEGEPAAVIKEAEPYEVDDDVDDDIDDVATVLVRVTGVLAMVVEHIDENRQQTRALAQVISDLSRPASSTYYDISLPDEELVDEELLDEASASESEEVWCRDNNGWVSGVEIIDESGENGSVRYWLRRKSDGYIFPRAFCSDDVMISTDAVGSGSSV